MPYFINTFLLKPIAGDRFEQDCIVKCLCHFDRSSNKDLRMLRTVAWLSSYYILETRVRNMHEPHPLWYVFALGKMIKWLIPIILIRISLRQLMLQIMSLFNRKGNQLIPFFANRYHFRIVSYMRVRSVCLLPLHCKQFL